MSNSHLHGDLVGAFEPDAVDFACEEVGLLFEDSDNFASVGSDESRGQVVGQAVSLEVDEELSCLLLFGPFGGDGLNFILGYAADFSESFGVVVEDIDGFVSEFFDDAFGGFESDAGESIGEEFGESDGGGREGDFAGGDFELDAVFGVHPDAFDTDFVIDFKGGEGSRHGEGDAFSGDGIENGEGIFRIDESDASDASRCLNGFADFFFEGGE